jgi:hypothetical protein
VAEIPATGRDPRGLIREAVENWALYRDTGRWPELRALYTADAIVHTTWFVGAASEFVDRCIAAAKGGSRSQHFIGAVSVQVKGERAIAESRAMLLVRAPLHGVEVDITCYVRFYDWFLRDGAGWRIRMRSGVYEKDRIDPVDPGESLRLDPVELARYPAAYRHIAYLQAAGGAHITPDLPTPGSDALRRLYADGARWLDEGS